MTAYVVFQEDIHDHAAFETYKQMSPDSIQKFGGHFIVRGGPIETLEGEFNHERMVVIAFPDADAARLWHQSADYADARSLRQKISSGIAVIVEGSN